ncbi:MAG: DUF3048 domain-containing protein [Bacilli bacterium]|nr:DUF3048 domain-containing protein [Bacilli bacterium]
MAKRKKNKKGNFIILILIFVVSVLIYFLINNKIDLKEAFAEIKGEVEIKNIKIVNQFSKSRPIAVMINNNHAAWPHAGLNDAYITYEIIAEGGITRLMAIFKDKDTSKIGSVRSSRPYYLDYALENDAIYVHFGYSEDARSDISSLGVDNINGLTDESVFWRDTTLNKAREHTAFTSMEKIKAFSKDKGYDRDTNKKLLLKYSADEIDLSKREDASLANSIFLKYSNYTNSSYEYDSENKVYKRSMSGVAHVDAITNEQYSYKNIIIAPLKNYSYDSYGRQKLDNIGTFDGYYITNGYSVPITFTKESRGSQTVYNYKDGSEIIFNDGNTFIQITPLGEEIRIG